MTSRDWLSKWTLAFGHRRSAKSKKNKRALRLESISISASDNWELMKFYQILFCLRKLRELTTRTDGEMLETITTAFLHCFLSSKSLCCLPETGNSQNISFLAEILVDKMRWPLNDRWVLGISNIRENVKRYERDAGLVSNVATDSSRYDMKIPIWFQSFPITITCLRKDGLVRCVSQNSDRSPRVFCWLYI
jgi:hypothetical protein